MKGLRRGRAQRGPFFAGVRSMSPAVERSESFPLGSGAGPYEGPSTAKRGVGTAPEGASMRPTGAGPLARKRSSEERRRYACISPALRVSDSEH